MNINWNKFEGLSDPRLQPTYPFVEHESEYGWVLVYDSRLGLIELACMVWDDYEDKVYYWVTPSGEELHSVTHWMPLPEKPLE